MTNTVLDLVRHAEMLAAVTGRAPSLHNVQPWRLRIAADAAELYADPERHLPVADPHGRQMYLGLGAALFALRLAIADLRRDTLVQLLPDGDQPNLVARLLVIGRRDPTPTESALLTEVERRRTVRTPFTDEQVPVPVRIALGDDAAVEGAALRWVEALGERRGVAALVAAGERRQQADPAYRAELAAWTATDALARGAGVPEAAFGVSAGTGHSAQFPMRDFAAGRDIHPPRPSRPVEEHPLIAVLTTAGDRPADWLTGGQAMMRVLLAASAAGLGSSQLNQPVELPDLRHELRDELRLEGWPQIVLRMGYPADPLPPPTPRRPVSELLLP
jgi:nitroreductase